MISAHAASEHGVHAAVVLIPVLYLVAVVLRARGCGAPSPPGHLARRTAVATTGLAAAVHVAVGIDHLGSSKLLAGVFLAAGAVQLAVCAAASRAPRRRALLTLAVVDLGLLGLWALTRTAGLPGGLGGREPVGVADGVVATCELAALLAVAVLLVRRRPRSGELVALPVELEPHRLATVRAEVAPAVCDGLDDRQPASGLAGVG